MNWYLLQTKPHAHATAWENLKRQNFEVFLPLVSKTTKKKGKFLDVKVPLFPGYIFMGTLMHPIPWKSVNGTRGISKAVTLDGIYRSINTFIIQGLQQRSMVWGSSTFEWHCCRSYQVERGPLRIHCTVEQIKDDQRAWILIDILQQQTRAEVSLDDVSKVN